jgi:twitching motility two-component system response regulator PilG
MLNISESSPSVEGQIPSTPLSRPEVVVPPLQVLQNIVLRQRSGRLTIHEPGDESVPWRIHAGKGCFHFADSLVGQRERLAYLLPRFNSGSAAHLETSLPSPFLESTYDYLYKSWQRKDTDLTGLRQLLYFLSQEALVWALTLPNAIVQFDRNVGLDPLLFSVPFQKSISPLKVQITGWRQLRPYLTSPFQRVQLVDERRFVQQFDKVLRSMRGSKATMTFIEALKNSPCLYELAVQLDIDILSLGKVLAELIRLEIVTVHPYSTVLTQTRPTIACIDDSAAVQRNVKLILEAEGYQVLSLTDPLRVLSSLVHEQPALVLMDISMPYIDGYELCRMLRQCSALKQTPIVMLTGRDGLVDRVRARLSGTVDYITKPFDAKTLLNVVKTLTHVEKK